MKNLTESRNMVETRVDLRLKGCYGSQALLQILIEY